MTTYVAVLRESGRELVVETANPNQLSDVVLAAYTTRTDAEERCEIENDPEKRALFVAGKLRVGMAEARSYTKARRFLCGLSGRDNME